MIAVLHIVVAGYQFCLTNMADRKPNPCIVKWILFTWYQNSPPFGRAKNPLLSLRPSDAYIYIYIYVWNERDHHCFRWWLSPAIIWNNADLLSIWKLRNNFIEIQIEIQTFSFKKIHLNRSCGKWRSFYFGNNVLISWLYTYRSLQTTFFTSSSGVEPYHVYLCRDGVLCHEVPSRR